MGSGGARGRSGPAPDPTALRRDRKDDSGTWVTLPGARTDAAPEWPLTEQTAREATHWERERRRPQAHQWAAQGQEVEVALYVRLLAEAEQPDAAANLRGEVRQRSEHLGLSLPGLARNRWRMPDASTPAATAPSTAARPARARPSSRDRFKVVPPVED